MVTSQSLKGNRVANLVHDKVTVLRECQKHIPEGIKYNMNYSQDLQGRKTVSIYFPDFPDRNFEIMQGSASGKDIPWDTQNVGKLFKLQIDDLFKPEEQEGTPFGV